MKKIILSVIACMVLLVAAVVVWDMSPVWANACGIRSGWFDALSGLLFFAALIPSCLFEEGRKELIKSRTNA